MISAQMQSDKSTLVAVESDGVHNRAVFRASLVQLVMHGRLCEEVHTYRYRQLIPVVCCLEMEGEM